jgi:long-subunit fatty acid transport protein
VGWSNHFTHFLFACFYFNKLKTTTFLHQKKRKMNKRFFVTLVFSLSMFAFVTAQNATDALKYSRYDFGGTARSLGSGSALGALGADFSVLSTNPAGLGWYRRSEFIFTPAIAASSVQSQLVNDKSSGFSEDSRSVFNLSSFGIIVAGTPRGGDWAGVNFGIGINRLADLNQQFYFRGDSRGSITDRFLELANSSAGLDDFESGVAFDAGAIYDFDSDGFYESDFELNPNALVRKDQTVTTKGSISEMVLSLAGNYRERVLIGATIGLPFVTFSENKTYREVDNGAGANGDVPFFDDLEYTERLTTTGVGINFKLGVVVRPHQSVRLGAAVHSPTAYRLEDSYSSSMVYNYTEDGQSYAENSESPDGLFEYKLRSPWRYIGSAGVIVGRLGFLSGEVELADYGNAKFRYADFRDAEREVNDSIVNTLTSAANIRLGAEVTYEIFRFRGGFGLHQSPYAGDNTMNNSFSAGFGIRGESFFIDFGYRHFNYKETYLPYLTSQAPVQFVDNEINNDQFLLTLGFKF